MSRYFLITAYDKIDASKVSQCIAPFFNNVYLTIHKQKNVGYITHILVGVSRDKTKEKVYNFFSLTRGLRIQRCLYFTEAQALCEHQRKPYRLVYGTPFNLKPLCDNMQKRSPEEKPICFDKTATSDILSKMAFPYKQNLNSKVYSIEMAKAIDLFLLQNKTISVAHNETVFAMIEYAIKQGDLPQMCFDETMQHCQRMLQP